jgi:penicillin G amidase
MKIVKLISMGLIILILIAVTSGFYFLNSKKPTRSGTINFPGLSQKIDIHFDQWAIPHIFAETQTDAYYALGYIHAQKRLFHNKKGINVS